MASNYCSGPRRNRGRINPDGFYSHHDFNEHEDLDVDLHIRFHHDYDEHDDYDFGDDCRCCRRRGCR